MDNEQREFKIYAYYKSDRYDCGLFKAESATAALIDAKRKCLKAAVEHLQCETGWVNFEIEEDFI